MIKIKELHWTRMRAKYRVSVVIQLYFKVQLWMEYFSHIEQFQMTVEYNYAIAGTMRYDGLKKILHLFFNQ